MIHGDRLALAATLALVSAASLLCAAASARAGLSAGDLVVSDLANARILRVTPTGAVSVLSPQGGPNLLERPTGVVVVPGGSVIVADEQADRLVEIDPDTGAQSVFPVFRRDAAGLLQPGDVGLAPWGLALDDFGTLWVAASGSDRIFHVGLATHIVQEAWSGAPLVGTAGPLGLTALALQFGTGVYVANAAGGFDAFVTGQAPLVQAPASGGSVWDIEIVPSTVFPIFLTLEQTPGSGFGCGVGSGVYGYVVSSGSALSLGGLLRCPFASALAPDANSLYVADAQGALGGGARVVQLLLNATPAPQILLASLPDGAAPTLPAGLA